MNKRADCSRIQEALPWYVNDTVAAAQQMEVKTHLQQCEDCAAEAEWLLAVKNEMPELAEESATDRAGVDTAFEQLLERIEKKQRKHERWQLLAAASVLLAIATLLGSLLTSYLLEPRFQTVTDAVLPEQEVVQVEVRFAPETQLASLRKVMEKTTAEVRTGPDADGWILLELPLRASEEPADVLAMLRADAQVLDARLVSGQAASDRSARDIEERH